ncbi:hypothetical protein [Kibdelosporangium philippinense]|uniref:hypothetical protein n=1 Tax=Kibdelosporangium philippinense TaxID=211113 RepID=UPI00360F8C79
MAVAKAYLADNQAAFGLSGNSVETMEVLVNRPMGQGSYVMLRQRFGDLPSMLDGLAVFGINNGAVTYLSSTLSPNRPSPEPATISPDQALASASADADLTADALGTTRVLLGAVPMPEGAPRAAYQVVLMSKDDEHPTASPHMSTHGPGRCSCVRTSSTTIPTTRSGTSSRPTRLLTTRRVTTACGGAW